MAEEPVAGATGLGRAFAEFTALPSLLRLPVAAGSDAPGWAELLEEQGFNEDHLEPEDSPRRPQDLTRFVADDAVQFCRRLRLLGDDDALTGPGRRIAELADGETPPDAGPDGGRADILADVLAEQIRRCAAAGNSLAPVGRRHTDGSRVLGS